MPDRVELDADALRRMYVDERMTTVGIAGQLGCGATTVSRRLRTLGIPPRSRGPRREREGDAEATRRWSAQIAWVVGLIATDGNLTGAGHRITLTSTDVDILTSARRCLGLSNRIGWSTGGLGAGTCRLQWRDRAFHEWLIAIGLTPRKSFTIGALKVPDEYFSDFVRGCIDGDGTAPSSSGSRPRSTGCSDSRAAFTPSAVPAGGLSGCCVCQDCIDPVAGLDVLRTRCPLSRPQAIEGRAVHPTMKRGYSCPACRRVGTGRRFRLKIGCP